MKQANKPQFKRYVFAENATETTIEAVPDTQTTEQEAQGYIGYQDGYTITNMKSITDGGKPPRGQQLNQLFKDITSVTQYATAGGTYSMDTTITDSTGYPKNAIICIDDVGLFRSLQDDNKVTDYNNANAWQKVVDFRPKIQRVVGEFFYSLRRLGDIQGALRCDGGSYNVSDYSNFINKYIKTGIITSKSINTWSMDKANNGCAGYFGYDNGDIFTAPYIQSGYYLSNAFVNGIDGKAYNVGDYHGDQITRIAGYYDISILSFGYPAVFNVSGCFTGTSQVGGGGNTTLRQGGNPDNWLKTIHVNYDTSLGTPTGDRVMPRTTFANLYVVVSDTFTEEI